MMPGSKEYAAWLKTIQVGDAVALYYSSRPRKEVITRETPAMFFVGGSAYRKKDGHSHGYGHGFIHPYTLDVKTEIRKRRMQNALAVAMPHALYRMEIEALWSLAQEVAKVSEHVASAVKEELES